MSKPTSDKTPTIWRARPEWDGKRLDREYAKGTSLRALAAQSGLSYGSVHRRLLEHGTKFRARGGWNRGPRDDA